MCGERNRRHHGKVPHCFWLYSCHEDEPLYLCYHGLDAGRAFETCRGDRRGVVANAKFRRDTGSDGGVLSGISGRSLVHEGACDSLPGRGVGDRVGGRQAFHVKGGRKLSGGRRGARAQVFYQDRRSAVYCRLIREDEFQLLASEHFAELCSAGRPRAGVPMQDSRGDRSVRPTRAAH